MINFNNTVFVKSSPNVKQAPQGLFPEVLLVGKSNVGKSSLINGLTGKKIAFTSSKPGHTRMLNYYNVDDKLYLVDAPGYGYAAGGVDLDRLFGLTMEDYFAHASRLKLVMVLLDSRRELGENDIEIINYLEDKNIKYHLVFTKKDKINQKETSALNKHLAELGIELENVSFTSIDDTKSIEKVRNILQNL